jgi:RNA ligase
MKYGLDILNDYIDRGLVVRQEHPFLPLSIYNYSRTCQYDGKWDEVTKDCRGLVLDSEGNVIAKPFPKFFNYEELVGNKWKHSEIPNEPFEVFEKMDGSLGILFNYNGEWIMATRGSFVSEQAIKGMELLRKYKYERLIKGFTYLFEIIYSENRIVCDYDFEDLILLAVIDNKDGYELQIHDDDIHIEGIRFRNLYNNLGLKVVKKYDGVKDFNTLKNSISNNQEGYVVRFKNGMRMKIKGDEYVRLHRILTNFSSIDIWELVKNGEPIEPFLERVPDEFDKWVKNKIANLQYAHFSISERCGKAHDYFRYGKYSDVDPEPTKKEYVEHVKKYTEPILHHIMFAMWDGKRDKVDELIWKLLKPKYEKPFTNDIDN